jgi:hypothetical protein
MLRINHEFKRGLCPLLAAMALLVLASPAQAGTEGNLEPVGTLLLEIDDATSQFRLDDGDAGTTDPVQQIFDRKIIKRKDSCLMGLSPDGSDPTDPNALVSIADSPTDWGIDTNKLALGARDGKGTGCGQIESGEIARIVVPYLLLTNASVQVEAKQDVSAKVTLILDDGVTETVVGTRYLLSGRSASDPPAEIAAAPPEHVSVIHPNRPDGGADSGIADDGFFDFEAPYHNIEVYQVVTNANGSIGKFSIKGGGEFAIPSANRSKWTAYDPDGLLPCAGEFSNEEGTATGSRTNEGACTSRMPFEFEHVGDEFTFVVGDTENQGAAFVFQSLFDAEAATFPIPRSILAYSASGIDCTDVDLEDPSTFTDACIGLTLCEGTPIRRCADGSGCREDEDCADDSTCRMIDLLPDGVFPDLVASSPETLEYGCICAEHMIFVGPGTCDDGSSCAIDDDCSDSGLCALFSEDQIAVEQCIFAIGDLKVSRRR